MPVIITIESMKLNKEQKISLVKELAPICSDILRVPAESIILIIRENEPDNMGSGPHLLSEKNKR